MVVASNLIVVVGAARTSRGGGRRRRPLPARHRARLLALAAAALGAVTPAALGDTWDGSFSTAWSASANWADNTEPTATDPVIFPTPIPASGGSISLSATEQAASLTFNDNYSLGANFLQLNAAGGPITVASGKTATISSNLTGTVGITKNGSGTLNLLATLNGFTGTTTIAGGTLSFNTNNDFGQAANTISLNSGTLKNNVSVTTTRTIDIGIFSPTIDQTNQWTQNGAFGASSNPINITGSGILALNAASTRTGSTTIQNGTVRLTNGAALGTGGTHVSSNGILELGAGVTATTFTVLQNTAILRTSGAGAADSGVSVDPSAIVKLNAGDVSTHTLTIPDFEGGSGSTTHVTGNGEVILSGSNTYTGAWAVDSGTLRLTHANSITSSASPIVINSGGIVSAEVASNYAGAWTIGGLLRVLHGQGTGTAAAVINVNASGALQVEGVDFTRNVALNGGGTLRGTGAATASGTITAANSVPLVTLASGATATDTLTVSNYTGGTGSTTSISGSGTVVLPSPSTYAGGWQVDAGTLRISDQSATGVGTSAVTINNGATLLLDSATTFSRGIAMNTGSTLKAGPGGSNAFISSTVSIASGADVNLSSATNGFLTVAQ